MKKRIRINESQLRKLIEQAINELDDRTYAHAAQMADRDYERYNDMAEDDNESPFAQAFAKQVMKRKQRQRDEFINRLNQGINKKMGLPSDTKMFNKDNIHGSSINFTHVPDFGSYNNTPRAQYARDMYNLFNDDAYYDKKAGKWCDKSNPAYDSDQQVEFACQDIINHPRSYQLESIIRNVTENVIRKLCRM